MGGGTAALPPSPMLSPVQRPSLHAVVGHAGSAAGAPVREERQVAAVHKLPVVAADLREIYFDVFGGPHALGRQLKVGRIVASAQHQHLLAPPPLLLLLGGRGRWAVGPLRLLLARLS